MFVHDGEFSHDEEVLSLFGEENTDEVEEDKSDFDSSFAESTGDFVEFSNSSNSEAGQLSVRPRSFRFVLGCQAAKSAFDDHNRFLLARFDLTGRIFGDILKFESTSDTTASLSVAAVEGSMSSAEKRLVAILPAWFGTVMFLRRNLLVFTLSCKIFLKHRHQSVAQALLKHLK